MNLRPRLAGFVVTALFVAACSPGTGPDPSAGSAGPSGTGATGRPAGSTTATPSGPAATDSGTPFPSLLSIALDTSGPIITGREDGPDGFSYALPGAAARAADGSYALFVVWFGSQPGDQMTTVQRSTDGRTWSEPVEVLQGVAEGIPQPGLIPTAALQLEDGTWALYGFSSLSDRGGSFGTWRAHADELEGPWVLDGRRLLVPGLPGAWDAEMAIAGAVQPARDGYLMWYEGEGPGSEVRGDVGLATSPDGVAWRKHDDAATIDLRVALSDPVLPTGICGVATGVAVEQPQVEPRAGGGFVAMFGGFGAVREHMDVFGAVSDDGRTWQCGSPGALIRTEDVPGSEGIHTLASVPLGDGRMGLIIESLRDEQSELWWATVEVTG